MTWIYERVLYLPCFHNTVRCIKDPPLLQLFGSFFWSQGEWTRGTVSRSYSLLIVIIYLYILLYLLQCCLICRTNFIFIKLTLKKWIWDGQAHNSSRYFTNLLDVCNISICKFVCFFAYFYIKISLGLCLVISQLGKLGLFW